MPKTTPRFFLLILVAVLLATVSATTTKRTTTTTTTTTHHATTTKHHATTHATATSTPTGKCTSSFKTHKLSPTPTPGQNKCKSFTDNFTSPKDVVLQEHYSGKPSPNGPNWIDISGTGGKGVVFGKDGLELLLWPPKKKGDLAYATTLTSAYRMQYGTVIAEMKVNQTPGLVNAFIMMSPAGDEIDWEFVGREPTKGQTNFYFQKYAFYVNGARYNVPGGAVNETFHKYGIHWTPETIQWTVDVKLIRTARKSTTWNACDKKYHFPYQGGNIQLGVWDGSQSPDWSHGPMKWSTIKGPLRTYVKSVSFSCDPTWNMVV